MKPRLRGYFHQEAFFVSLGACALLIAKSTYFASVLASTIYSISVLLLFGVSALYHRLTWRPKARSLWKRLDHSAIFLLIAGTMTPVALLVLPQDAGRQLLMIVWTVAALGAIQSIFWVSAPKWVTALYCILTGWIAFPYLPLMKAALSGSAIALIVAGGVAYTLGALFYALKRPNLAPGVFGYHELFHVLTIVGAAFHFVVIHQIVN